MKYIENIELEGKNGRPILCDLRFDEKEADQSLIIFCHGFKGFKDWGHFNLIADQLVKNGFIVLKFNFSHNGGTMEKPIDFSDLEAFGENDYIKELNDIEVVLNDIEKGSIAKELNTWNLKTFLIGHSRGGGIAVLKANEDPRVHKVVSWAGVSDFVSRLPNPRNLKRWKESGVFWMKNSRTYQDMPMYYNFVEVLYANEKRLNIKNACENLSIPHLIIHGTSDESVSYLEGKEIQSWNKEATFFEIESAGHTFGGKHPFEAPELPDYSKIMIEKTTEFLNAQ
jgi:pimeloyl-ACP methyl ester carboxylesterase